MTRQKPRTQPDKRPGTFTRSRYEEPSIGAGSADDSIGSDIAGQGRSQWIGPFVFFFLPLLLCECDQVVSLGRSAERDLPDAAPGDLVGDLRGRTGPRQVLAFAPATPYPAGPDPAALAVGDLDRDGLPDVMVTGPGTTEIRVLRGTRGGILGPAMAYSAGQKPVALALGDFNRDGRLDLAVAVQKNGTVSVLLGAGDGSFGPPVSQAAGSGPTALFAADLDGDGRLDLAVADGTGSRVVVLLDGAGGTLSAGSVIPAYYPVPTPLLAIAAGDVAGTGGQDLLGASAGTYSLLAAKGAGRFGPAQAQWAADGVTGMVLVDLNHDGHPDLVLCSGTGSAVIVLINIDGHLQDGKLALRVAAGLNPQGVAVADFNADGHPDIAVANTDDTVSVLLGRGDGSFDLPRGFPAGVHPSAIAAADLDGDGLPDLVLADRASGTIGVLRNTSQ